MLRQTHFNHGILFQKLFLTVRKKCFSKEKLFKITQTIYLNSERSKQFLKQNSLICYVRTIKVPIETNNWDVKTYRNKLEKEFCPFRLSITLVYVTDQDIPSL